MLEIRASATSDSMFVRGRKAQTTDEAFRQLIAIIQQALVGAEPSQLGQDLAGRYKDDREAILRGIEAEKEENQ